MSAQMSEGLIGQLVAGGSADAAMTTLPAQALSAVELSVSRRRNVAGPSCTRPGGSALGRRVGSAGAAFRDRADGGPAATHPDVASGQSADDSPALAAYTMNLHRVRGVQHLQLEGLRTEESSLYPPDSDGRRDP